MKSFFRDVSRNNVPYAVALFLAVVGILKMFHLGDLSEDISKFWLVPAQIRFYLPFLVPVVEVWVAALIFVPATRKVVLGLSVGLFASFIVFHIWNYQYGLIESCHCLGISSFGLSNKASAIVMIALNVATILSILSWLFEVLVGRNPTDLHDQRAPTGLEAQKGIV